jgi:hypothetical protein
LLCTRERREDLLLGIIDELIFLKNKKSKRSSAFEITTILKSEHDEFDMRLGNLETNRWKLVWPSGIKLSASST